MSSGRSHVSRGRSTRASRESTPPSFGAQEEASFDESRSRRSSGKRPLTAREANHYEALARKRSSSKTGSSNLEPVIISDDEGEDRTEPTFAWDPPQPQCKPGFPDPASIGGYGWKPPVDLDGPLLRIQPLAIIDPGSGSIDPDSSTVKGVLQRLENALKQAISIIGVGWGDYADLHPFLVDCLGEVRRVGGTQLALRCDRRLVHWESLVFRAEELIFFEPYNEVSRLIGEARVKIMRERETRVLRILEQEMIATDLRKRQHRLQRMMATYTPTAARTGVQLTLEDLKRESTNVHRALSKTMETIHVLKREEEASVAALSEERLEKEAEAQVQANWAKDLSALKAELKAFTVLDCA